MSEPSSRFPSRYLRFSFSRSLLSMPKKDIYLVSITTRLETNRGHESDVDGKHLPLLEDRRPPASLGRTTTWLSISSTNQMCNYSTSTLCSIPVLFACQYLVIHEKNHVSTRLQLDPTSKCVQSLARNHRQLPQVARIGADHLEHRAPLLLMSNRRGFLVLDFLLVARLASVGCVVCGTCACLSFQGASDKPRDLESPGIMDLGTISRRVRVPA